MEIILFHWIHDTGIGQEIVLEVISKDQVPLFTEIAEDVVKLTILHPAIRVNLLDLLTVLSYPFPPVWTIAVTSWQSEERKKEFTSNLVTSVMKELVSLFIN